MSEYTIHRSSQEVKLSPPATSATDIEGKTSCVGGDQERRQEEKFRKSEEATEVIRRFVDLMHISLEHIGAPLEVGTKISVFWKEDDDWHNGLIDAGYKQA